MMHHPPQTHNKPETRSAVERFRADKDRHFATNPNSPLTAQQRQEFRGLSYFPEDPALRQEVRIEPADGPATIVLQVSSGGTQTYRRFGRVKVTIGDTVAELTVFANEHGFFLPFADALAGSETYGAGRYLEPQPLGNGRFRIDFNYAYNPYCAYNDRWSCPVTPAENRLHVAIRAGEKLYSKTGR